MTIVFLALGLLAGTLGGFLLAYKRAFSIGTGILFLALGALLLSGRKLTGFSFTKTDAGPFLLGILFALGWSACTGPIVALALVLAASTGTALSGALMLFFYAAGLLTPLAIVAALLAAITVAGAGLVGFVGLVVPAIGRAFGIRRARELLIASAVLGAALVVFADVVARTVRAPAELPLGAVTALVGVPFFLVRLRRAA